VKHEKDTEVLVALNMVEGIGVVLYRRLLQAFWSLQELPKLSTRALQTIRGIGPTLADDFTDIISRGRHLRELEFASKNGVRIVPYSAEEYPRLLKAVFDHPLVLYVKGKLPAASVPCVAVVGCRRPTFYGQHEAEKLSYALAARGVGVVSGLARGIDTSAHTGALKAKGLTYAVLGGGLLKVYPAENRKLFDRICEKGACVSEVPLNSPPNARTFPRRNRIVSGMSLGVVVVEAGTRSGALITADWALEQNREVFAVPGKIDSPQSVGCHNLIKRGAKLVQDLEDVLEELGHYGKALAPTPREKGGETKPPGLSPAEELLLSLLSSDPAPIDALISESQLTPATVSAKLLSLELKKLVKQLPGKNFVRLI
jgi:DNA processing protein